MNRIVRNVLVTGGTSGVGRNIAAGFVASGDRVIICARTQSDCERVAQEISNTHTGVCTGFAADISKVNDIERLAREVAAHFGILHVLVNNAGCTARNPLDAVTEEEWDRVVDLNMKAVLFMTQKMAPHLRKAATAEVPASVINMGSIAATKGGPGPHYPYQAAKAGMQYMTKSLARGLAPDHINVNAIQLGVFPHDSVNMRGFNHDAMNVILQDIPARRFGDAPDIIGLTQFLASPASSYITGAVIPLDGGMHI